MLQLITILMINLQWAQISRKVKGETSFWGIMHVNMAGTFVESVTPAVKAGGELTKVLMLQSRLAFSPGEALAVVTMQKAFSMLTFLGLSLICLTWLSVSVQLTGLHQQVLLSSFGLLILICGLVLTMMFKPNSVMPMVNKMPISLERKQKIEGHINSFIKILRNNARDRKFIRNQLIFGLAIWLFFAIKAYLLTRSLNIQIGLIPVAAITYLTYMVGMIPLTPGGLGAFEGSMVFFIAPFGVTVAQGVALALVLRFVTFWFVFLCSAIYVGIIELKNNYSAIY